jgi:hypothetical protein
MNERSQKPVSGQQANAAEARRRPVRTVIAVLCLLFLGPIVIHWALKHATARRPAETAVVPEKSNRTSKANDLESGRRAKTSGDQFENVQGGAANSSATAQGSPQPDLKAYMRQLITNLSSIDLTNGKMTRDKMDQWRKDLQQLVSQGTAAVGVIREYLQSNEDVDFRKIADTRFLGHETLRTALLDALQQIGGPEAIGAALQTLQTTADPTEIAMLGKYLIDQDSGQYREAILTAAREMLAQATAGGLGNRDLNAVFELLQRYGGTSVVADLENAAAQWSHYAAMALAGLPDEAGIPALTRLANNPNGNAGVAAVVALAGKALSSDQAANALQLVGTNNIQCPTWSAIAQALAGFSHRFGNEVFPDRDVARGDTQTHSDSSTNQKYRGVQPPDTLSPEQINRGIRTIDQLLQTSLVSQNPCALTPLYNARNSLARMAPR